MMVKRAAIPRSRQMDQYKFHPKAISMKTAPAYRSA